MSRPEVSIIIPAYNASQLIVKALQSVSCQTCDDIECIVVDDGSTDDTASAVERYIASDTGGKRFELIRSEKNAGQSAARNLALGRVSGEYVFFLDADDLITPECIEAHLERARKYGVDFTDSAMVASSGANLFVKYPGEMQRHDAEQVTRDFFGRIRVTPCNKLIRSSLFADGALRFPEGMYYEDVSWAYDLCLAASSYALFTDATYVYTANPQSTTRRRDAAHIRKRMDSYLRMMRMMAERVLALKDPQTAEAGRAWMRNFSVRVKHQVSLMPVSAAAKREFFSALREIVESTGRCRSSMFTILDSLPYSLFRLCVAEPFRIYRKIKKS